MVSREFDEETERRLLANDPTLTSLSLCYPEVTHVAPRYSQRVGRAIASSTHLTKLVLELDVFQDDIASFVNGEIDNLDGTALQEIKNYISSSSVLTLLHLKPSVERHSNEFNVARHFFDAVNQRVPNGRNALKNVLINGLDIEAEDLTSLVRNGGLANCTILRSVILHGSFDSEEAVRQVAESFAVNTSLTSLILGAHQRNESFIRGILEALPSRRALEILTLVNDYRFFGPPSLLIEALAKLITSSPDPLKRLNLHGFSWTVELFSPISKAMSVARKVLSFYGGSWDDGAMAQLRSLYSQECKFPPLCLCLDVEFPNANNHQVLTELVGSTPGLALLEINESADPNANDRFRSVMKGLVSSSCAVRAFLLTAKILPESQLEMLINAIPHFRSVDCLGLFVASTSTRLKGKLMAAFQSNRSLRKVHVEDELFNAADRARLDVYLERNRSLPNAIQSEANAMTVPDHPHDTSTNGSVTTGARLPPLFQASMDSSVTIGVSHVFGGLVRLDENFGTTIPRRSVKRRLEPD